jgi:hypothetical protein
MSEDLLVFFNESVCPDWQTVGDLKNYECELIPTTDATAKVEPYIAAFDQAESVATLSRSSSPQIPPQKNQMQRGQKRKREHDCIVPSEVALVNMRPSECTPEERSVRKKAKNRLAAAESRARRKDEIDSLQAEVARQSERANNLDAAVGRLTAENATLAKEVLYLRRVISQQSSLSSILSRFEDISQMTPRDSEACGICVNVAGDGKLSLQMCAECSDRCPKQARHH